MSHKTLPYLHSLQETLAQLAPALAADPNAAMRIDLGNKLLDYMIVQREVAPKLQTDCFTALGRRLPEIGKALAVTPPRSTNDVGAGDASTTLSELGEICLGADTASFDRFLALAGGIERQLLAANTPQATALCKSMLAIEAEYCRKFAAAVVALNQAGPRTGGSGSAARNAREFDAGAVAAFMRDTFADETKLEIANSAFVSGGYSKFTVSIMLANAKSLPANIILRGDASATFGGVSVVDEYQLIKAVHDNGVCVPKPLALESTGKVFGSPFVLFERRPGTVIGHMFKLPALRSSPLIADIARKLAAVHAVPLAAVGGKIDGANSRSSDKALAWIDEAEAAWTPLGKPSAVFFTAFEWLRRNAGIYDRAPRKLVHGDYGLNNLLIENDSVTAILDWEFAHIGNPAYDLGYFYPMAIGLAPWQEFLDAYANTGMPMPDQQQLDYSILLAATRLGVMLCQTVAVFTSGVETGIAGTAVMAGDFYDTALLRVAEALDRVL